MPEPNLPNASPADNNVPVYINGKFADPWLDDIVDKYDGTFDGRLYVDAAELVARLRELREWRAEALRMLARPVVPSPLDTFIPHETA